MAYNINCQYHVHFLEWMHGLDWSLPFTIHTIGKCHLYVHKDSCHGTYSFNYILASGRTDGEESEQGWPACNAIAASTREMSSGHRRNVINDHSSDTNFRKLHAIGVVSNASCWTDAFLPGSEMAQKLKQALQMQLQFQDEL